MQPLWFLSFCPHVPCPDEGRDNAFPCILMHMSGHTLQQPSCFDQTETNFEHETSLWALSHWLTWALLTWLPAFQNNTNSSIFRRVYVALLEMLCACAPMLMSAWKSISIRATSKTIGGKRIWNITLILQVDDKEGIKTSISTTWTFTSCRNQIPRVKC